jgi:hypothetical protein
VDDRIAALSRENRDLRKEVASLRRWAAREGGGLQGMLQRRGFRVHRMAPRERMLVSPDDAPLVQDRMYELLKRYSCRLLLRDAIRIREGFRPEDLTAYCSTRAARAYCTALREIGLLVENQDGAYGLKRRSVNSFGETLEWFAAEILRREFYAEVVHGVSLRTPPPGGDFDVIAAMEGLLVYVETKSSPPRGIEAEEVAGFLERYRILAPHLALFLVDTHLRMWDKMAPILEELAGGVHRDSGLAPRKVQRLEREIFHWGHRIYILNSSRGILSNLRCCFLDFLRRGNPGTATEWDGTRGIRKA